MDCIGGNYMNFGELSNYFVAVVVLACLIVGYLIKHATFLKRIPNNDIPVILAFVGAILNCVVSGLSVDSVVYGAMMGLASTGLHQGFTRFIEGDTSEDTDDKILE